MYSYIIKKWKDLIIISKTNDLNIEQDFFQSITGTLNQNEHFITLSKLLKKYSADINQHIYFINKPLLDNSGFNYQYDRAAVIFIPGTKMLFCNFSAHNDDKNDNNKFATYRDNFLEDLNSLISKYNFQEKIGRISTLKESIVDSIDVENEQDVLTKIEENSLPADLGRKMDIILSLAIGSVNNANSFIPEESSNTLDKIKNQIILFDADQTTFMYKDSDKKRITVQGLAGTGKTELLFHKLVNLYRDGVRTQTRIVFTFFNQILEAKLRSRVISFFNYMQVTEQIKWDERLWVMRGWGSASNCNSGVYAFICQYYQIPFQRYQRFPKVDFDKACKDALSSLNQINSFKTCFDDILIDESQDFPESFLELCEKVTQDKVIIAGDIFQDIFSNLDEKTINPDFLLNRVYRTDTRTFMFAQSIGFGLQEKNMIRWLSDDEWRSCGYIINKNDDQNPVQYSLTRSPIRRFEDLDNVKDAIELELEDSESIVQNIITTIINLRESNPTMKASDIAIIFLTEKGEHTSYNQATELSNRLENELNWSSNKGYETRNTNADNVVFISNQNNIKGLEFPFVICVVNGKLTPDNINARNALYMMLTRSFISSKLLLTKNSENEAFYKAYKPEVQTLLATNQMCVNEPLEGSVLSKDHLKQLANAINMTPDELVLHVLSDNLSINKNTISQNTLRKFIATLTTMGVELNNYDDVTNYIQCNLTRVKKLFK